MVDHGDVSVADQGGVSVVGQGDVSVFGQGDVNVVGKGYVSANHDPSLPLWSLVPFPARADVKNHVQLDDRRRQ